MIEGKTKWNVFSYLSEDVNILYVYVPSPISIGSLKILEELQRVIGTKSDTIAKVSFYMQDEPGFIFKGKQKNLPEIYYRGEQLKYSQFHNLEEFFKTKLREEDLIDSEKKKVRFLKGDENII